MNGCLNVFLHEQVTQQGTWELKRTFSQKQEKPFKILLYEKKTYIFMMLLIIRFSLFLHCMPQAAFALHDKR